MAKKVYMSSEALVFQYCLSDSFDNTFSRSILLLRASPGVTAADIVKEYNSKLHSVELPFLPILETVSGEDDFVRTNLTVGAANRIIKDVQESIVRGRGLYPGRVHYDYTIESFAEEMIRYRDEPIGV